MNEMLPDKYLDKMKELLKDEYDDYINSFNLPSYHGLRVNTNKISVDDFIKIFPYTLEKIPWTSDGFYYTDEEVSKHPYYYAGLYYIQEPSAMLPAECLNIEENDIVLDACAAPGGKSLKLLNKLNNTGILISNDISTSRANALLRNIERQGFTNYFVISEDAKKLEKNYYNTFDKILLDAPCSGEGMFRKDSSLIKSWKEKGNEYYANIQKELIISCLNMLKSGGQLLYSTCTFDTLEDEEVIKYALNKYDDLSLVSIKMLDGFIKGKDDIGVKLFPHRIKGEGHYVCLIQKGNKIKNNNVNNEVIKINNEFINKYISKEFKNGEFKNINNSLYFVPNFDTDGIRTLRSGLLLGEERNKFNPSQALALALKENEFKNIINFDVTDIRVNKFLKGETININSDLNDCVLICVSHFPIGFGILNNGVLKNKIDKGWIKR